MKIGDKVRVKDQLHLGVWRCQVGQISSISGEIYYVNFCNGKGCTFFEDELTLVTDETPPEPYILIPVGEYDGSGLYDYYTIDGPYCHGQFDTLIDDFGVVWSVLPNLEAECIIIGE